MHDISPSSFLPPILPSDHNYTSYYCEENIYLLADTFHHDNAITNAWEINVVFVSNETKTVALWSQKPSQDPDHPVVWDYHCILVLRPRLKPATEPAWVYDYDSRLAIPCCWSDYVQTTFRMIMWEVIPEQYRSKFRVVPVAEFLDNFASDRSHMLTTPVLGCDPEYIAPPPNHSCIIGRRALDQGVSNNLMQVFVKMFSPGNDFKLEGSIIGKLMSDVEFWDWGWECGEQLSSLDNNNKSHELV